ncbi:hypothetical protein, partial [Ligilactobacillus equi]|uniref:hypothetical protein n=1 Tax=Ligilactobacillus equi TaxID=137357 RepID=UPI001CDA91AF
GIRVGQNLASFRAEVRFWSALSCGNIEISSNYLAITCGIFFFYVIGFEWQISVFPTPLGTF